MRDKSKLTVRDPLEIHKAVAVIGKLIEVMDDDELLNRCGLVVAVLEWTIDQRCERFQRFLDDCERVLLDGGYTVHKLPVPMTTAESDDYLRRRN